MNPLAFALISTIFFSPLTANNLHAQKAKLYGDSLWALWSDNTLPDTTRFYAADSLMENVLIDSLPDSAIRLAKKQLSLFADDVKLASKANYNIGIIYYIMYELQNAQPYLERCMELELARGDSVAYIQTNDILSELYYDISSYAKSLKSLKNALKYYKRHNDSNQYDINIANSYLIMGNIYSFFGNYPKGIAMYEKSLKIFKSNDDEYGVAAAITNIGSIYEEQGNYTKALEYYEQGLALDKKNKDPIGMAYSYQILGNCFFQQNEYKQAELYHRKSLALADSLSEMPLLASVYEGLGASTHKQGQNAKARRLYAKALDIYHKMGAASGRSSTLLGLAEVYLSEDHLDSALQAAQRAYQITQSTGEKVQQHECAAFLYTQYRNNGQSDSALYYLEKRVLLDSSLQVEETISKLERMESEKILIADSLKQEEEKARLALVHAEEMQRESRSRNMALGAGAFLLLIAAGLFGRVRIVNKSRKAISKEKQLSEELLHNILPAEIAHELKTEGKVSARNHDDVTIIFTDFKSFTERAEKMGADRLVAEINTCFKAFDHICEQYGVEKIKTIGDAYMAAGGLTQHSPQCTKNTLMAAIKMAEFMKNWQREREVDNKETFQMRVGVHTGKVIAGIVGVKKFQYDIWGDTVNTASRMESNGEIGKVNISQTTFELLKNDPDFSFVEREECFVKGKGQMKMWFAYAHEASSPVG